MFLLSDLHTRGTLRWLDVLLYSRHGRAPGPVISAKEQKDV